MSTALAAVLGLFLGGLMEWRAPRWFCGAVYVVIGAFLAVDTGNALWMRVWGVCMVLMGLADLRNWWRGNRKRVKREIGYKARAAMARFKTLAAS